MSSTEVTARRRVALYHSKYDKSPYLLIEGGKTHYIAQRNGHVWTKWVCSGTCGLMGHQSRVVRKREVKGV